MTKSNEGRDIIYLRLKNRYGLRKREREREREGDLFRDELKIEWGR